jgi:hypothetical protein
MYDPTFHFRTLERQLLKLDFAREKKLSVPAVRASIVTEAVDTATKGFSSPIRLRRALLRGKPVFQPTHLSDHLILRLITKNLQRLTRVKQSNRDAIIRSLKAMLGEGLDYRAYKIDIRNFYETVDIVSLVRKLEDDPGFPRDSLRLLKSFFSEAQKAGIIGLPRGIALSATLAEYLMRDFDERVSTLDGVYFYSRFVDDILILTTAKEDPARLLGAARQSLFPGLALNPQKTRYADFRNAVKGSKGDPAGSFEFLGYQFQVHQRQNGDDGIYRDIHLDFASGKITRLKSRIVRSFREFMKNGNFVDLRDRLKLLSGNYNIYDEAKSIRRNSGLYCSYRLVDLERSKALPDLDRFLRTLILSPRGIFRGSPKFILSTSQRRELLGLSFRRGFQARIFYHFHPTRLHQLTRCWAYA